jgi:hypothetical protein
MRSLILSCSASKSTAAEPLPALERYRGPAFTVVRRYLRAHPAALTIDLQIGILSAEYGLIGPDTLIPPYNRRMTRGRAVVLQPHVIAVLRDWLAPQKSVRIFMMLGKDYQPAVEPLDAWLPGEVVEMVVAAGGSGRKQQQLARWLDGVAEEQPGDEDPIQIAMDLPELEPRGHAVLRGTTIKVTSDEILRFVRKWIAEGDEGYRRSRDWLAQVGPYAVAPKWLAARLSGVPVSRFTADEARRVLQQLGIPLLRR